MIRSGELMENEQDSMNIFSCLTLGPFVWDQIYKLFVIFEPLLSKLDIRNFCRLPTEDIEALDQSNEIDKPLPYDTIVDIFTRLPAETVAECVYRCKSSFSVLTSPYFVDMHLARATPMIAFQYCSHSKIRRRKLECEVDINFTDVRDSKTMTKRIKVDTRFALGNKYCMPFIYGSYNGFLILRDMHEDSVLYIWNPVTRDKAVIIRQDTVHFFQGFYFHPTSGEYRVIYMYLERLCFKFIVLSLTTKFSRIINSSYPPSGHKLPTILNGALHWIIEDYIYKKKFGDLPHCSNSIISFNMDTEDFSTMPHPGGQCTMEEEHHLRMELMHFEGCLCLCDASSGIDIVIWILKDYDRKVWARRHVVSIEPMKKTCSARQAIPEFSGYLQAIHIFGDQLFFRITDSELFLYDLHSGTFKRAGKKGLNSDIIVPFPISHVNSLISLHIDDIISLPS